MTKAMYSSAVYELANWKRKVLRMSASSCSVSWARRGAQRGGEWTSRRATGEMQNYESTRGEAESCSGLLAAHRAMVLEVVEVACELSVDHVHHGNPDRVQKRADVPAKSGAVKGVHAVCMMHAARGGRRVRVVL